MLCTENDLLTFESLIKDAFNLFRQAADMVEDHDDHPELVTIKKLIESEILCYEESIINEWLKEQAEKAKEMLDEIADHQET